MHGDAAHDQVEAENGYVHVPSPNMVPKDTHANDQGDYYIDGLIVTDKLLGIPTEDLF